MWEWASAQGVTTIPLGFSVYFLSPPLGSALCKIGLVPATNQERECKWVNNQGQLTVARYMTIQQAVLCMSFP